MIAIGKNQTGDRLRISCNERVARPQPAFRELVLSPSLTVRTIARSEPLAWLKRASSNPRPGLEIPAVVTGIWLDGVRIPYAMFSSRGSEAMIVDTHTRDHFQRDRAYHDRTARLYDEVVIEPRRFANRLLFAQVERFVPRGGAMLDLACGTGHMLIRYGERFERSTGIDQSRGMLEEVERKLEPHRLERIELITAEVFDFLATDRRTYDFVTCVGFVHHLPVELYGHLLDQIRPRLSCDGVLMLAEPVVTIAKAPPVLVQRWNERSVMRERARLLANAETESVEAPLPYETFAGVPMERGFRRLCLARGWELFPHHLPEWLSDRIAIRLLDALYGRSGSIVLLVLARAEGPTASSER